MPAAVALIGLLVVLAGYGGSFEAGMLAAAKAPARRPVKPALPSKGGTTRTTAASTASGSYENVSRASSSSPRRCRTQDLGLTVRSYGGGGGTEFYLVVLRNHSQATCSVRGYPGVSGLDRRRHQVGRAARRISRRVERVRLRPAARASSLLLAIGTARCNPLRVSRFVRVFPPDERRPLVRRARLAVCQLKVGPLRPGALQPNRR